MNRFSITIFVRSLMIPFGLMVYATWLVCGTVSTAGASHRQHPAGVALFTGHV